MLTGKDFIVFSDDWGRHPFSCMHLMNQFLIANRILWVNTIGMRYPKFTAHDLKRAFGKINGWVSQSNPQKLPKNLEIISPLMIPYNNIPMIRKFNQRSVVTAVRNACDRLDFSNPILIATVPNACDYIGYCREKKTIYYCVDEFSEWPGVAKELVLEMEEVLLQKAQCVVAVSDHLLQSKKQKNSNAYLLTHGVDVKHFRSAIHQVHSIAKLDEIPKPIIGYFGLFDERSDQELLEYMLTKRPDWSIVIIGNSVVNMDRLLRFGNFYHIGAVNYDDLPTYASYFEVCLIPYLVNPLTQNINPLKLKEYLATTKPVVSTALPEAINLNAYLELAYNHEELVDKIEMILQGKSQKIDSHAFVLQEDWSCKAEVFSTIIENIGLLP